MPLYRMMAKVSEPFREWETFKYYSSHLPSVVSNDIERPIPSSALLSAPDTVLASFTQHGALRLNSSRALISLFDRQYQYIIAEATTSIPLKPNVRYVEEHLWLCGTAIPRAHGICEHVLVRQNDSTSTARQASNLPVSVVPDLAADVRFCERSFVCGRPFNRFYAGVPLRSPNGINVGVYCVFDDKPRAGLDRDEIAFLQDMSITVMSYLDSKRTNETFRRCERIVQGLGYLVNGREEALPLSPLNESLPSDTPFGQLATSVLSKGAPPTRQQSNPIRPRLNQPAGDLLAATLSTDSVESAAPVANSPDPHMVEVRRIFTNAAEIIRQAIDVDGVLFADATVGSFGGLVGKRHKERFDPNEGSSSSDDSAASESFQAEEPSCGILGFSTSGESILGQNPNLSNFSSTVPEKFLRKLLRWYPQGKIFSFDESGATYSGESESDSVNGNLADENVESPDDLTPPADQRVPRRPTASHGVSYSRRNESRRILEMFPGSRSIAFIPVWDPYREQWYAGGCVWSTTPARILTPDGDLPHLRAFGMITMAEIARLNMVVADKVKTDILGSLSHELRSPLHAVVTAAELLHDTDLTAFQVDMIHTVEISGKTLLDTMDHLLDYSKINTFLRSAKVQRKTDRAGRGMQRDGRVSIESGMMGLVSDVHVDLVTEEVIESMFIGHCSRYLLAGSGTSDQESVDTIYSSDDLGQARKASEEMARQLSAVQIIIDMDPNASWVFHTQPGALRRIVMNIFGNALKYTASGFIRVGLRQEPASNKASRTKVILTVTDSGKGISEQFLRNQVFTPFSQEDHLAPGAGLGLSLVRQMVGKLGGTITVTSEIGYGTIVSVSLPLPSSQRPSARDPRFLADMDALKGLRVGLRGFTRSLSTPRDDHYQLGKSVPGLYLDTLPLEWLRLHIMSDDELAQANPDIIICSEAVLDELRAAGSSSPVLVVCRNAAVAQKLSAAVQSSSGNDAFEFISQPTGPRKLAKALAFILRRWKETHIPRLANEVDQPSEVSTTPMDLSVATDPARVLEHPSEATDTVIRPKILPQQSSRQVQKFLPPPPSGGSGRAETLVPGDGSDFLLVDDNPVNLRILSAFMKRLDRPHVTAPNGLVGLETYKLEPGRFSCILMDISMPIMDGLEATRQIRHYERLHQLKPVVIIAITSLGSTSARQEAYASGLDLFLTRPVRLVELNSILESKGLK